VNWQAYRVKRGERLDHIAAHFGMTVAALCEANSINAKERLKPGSEILVALHHVEAPATNRHAESMLAVAKPMEESSEAPANGGIIRASYTPAASHVSPVNYTVRRGDTLFSISQHFHVTVAELKHMNRLRGDALQPGASMRIAEAEKTVARR
jgi:membrane-bound lytic murein transglycosylase D